MTLGARLPSKSLIRGLCMTRQGRCKSYSSIGGEYRAETTFFDLVTGRRHLGPSMQPGAGFTHLGAKIHLEPKLCGLVVQAYVLTPQFHHSLVRHCRVAQGKSIQRLV